MEWLLGNGRGDFASGSASEGRDRARHALLAVAGSRGRARPWLLRLDARAVVNGREFDLPPAPPADATRNPTRATLDRFDAVPWPRWRHRMGDAALEQTLVTIHGHPAVIVSFRHLGGPPLTLTIAPVLDAAARTHTPHTTAPGSDSHGPGVEIQPGRVCVMLGPGRSLTLWHGGVFAPAGARAADALAAAGAVGPGEAAAAAPAPPAGDGGGIVPGSIEAKLAPGEALHVIASAEEHLMRTLAQEDRLGSPPPRTLAACVAAIETGERARHDAADRATLAGAGETARQARAARHPGTDAPAPGAPPGADDRWTVRLARSLAAGHIEREGRPSFVRSLPGGAEDGEAAFSAVRALVALRDFDRARDVLCAWVRLVRDGLAPSGFDPVDGWPRYDGPEASLWLVISTELYARRSRDHDLARGALYPALEEVLTRFRAGTRLGLRVEGDSLLVSGEGARAARRADLNALWYHAQAAMGQLARATGRGEHGAFHLAWAREHQARFNEAMWDEEGGCLYEALTADGPVRGLAPGQLLAVRQPPLLPPERALRLVQTIERGLFTPIGLRETRGATRLATEWLGPFLAAYLRVHGRSAEAQAQARAWLDALAEHLESLGATHLPVAFESADGAPPSNATMAEDADAVSVVAAAELLRTWVEEFDHSAA